MTDATDAVPPPAPATPAPASPAPSPGLTLDDVVRGVSVFACAYHGYRRSGPLGVFLWAGAASVAPYMTPAVALAVGFAMPEAEAAAWRARGYQGFAESLRTAEGLRT